MEWVVAAGIFFPFFLVAAYLILRVIKPVDNQSFSPSSSTKFEVWIEEVNYPDGNILVKNETIFKEGLMLSHPDPSRVFRGQRVVLRKRGVEWEMIL